MSSTASYLRRHQGPFTSTRRGFLLAAGAILATGAIHSRAGTAQSGVYRGNAARTGVIDELGPTETPSEKWFSVTGVSVSATPQIVASTVYVGDLNGTIWALNANDGREMWRHETGVAIWSAATIVDGVVYFGNEDGILFALSASTGEKLWDLVTEENLQASPLVIDQVVYVAGWDGFLYALDRVNGTERWKTELGAMVEASPTFADGRLYISADRVYALDPLTGEVVWTSTDEALVASLTVAFSEGLLYAIGFGELFAINAGDGSLVWHCQLGDYSYPAPAVANGLVIVTSERFDFQSNKDIRTVHAFDVATGAVAWEYEPADAIWADPVVAGDALYLSDISGGVYALRAADGSEIWRFAMETAQTGQLTVADGTLFIAASDGVLALA